jgi:hypothetical protein
MVEFSVPLELVLKNPPKSTFMVRVEKKIIKLCRAPEKEDLEQRGNFP